MGYTLGILGCGTMGSAVLNATLEALKASAQTDLAPTETVFASVNSEGSKKRLETAYGASVNVYTGASGNTEVLSHSDVVILGCKPFVAESLLKAIPEGSFKGKTVVSLMAGITIDRIKELCPGACVVGRAMTNTPSKIGYGMTVISLYESPDYPENDHQLNKKRIDWLFNNTGKCVFLEEKYQDVATALCGSGPAFIYVMLEALIEGAVQKGMPYKVAQECATQVLIGAGKLVQESGEHPAALKSQVCTPGGTTIGGLLVMEDNKVRSGISRAVEEASNIATRLGKK